MKQIKKILLAMLVCTLVCLGVCAEVTYANDQVKRPVKSVINYVQPNAINQLVVNFTKPEGVEGFVVYRSTDNITFKKKATCKNIALTEYTDKRCVPGVTYYYYIKTFITYEGKRIYSRKSNVMSGTISLAKPQITSIVKKNGDSFSIKWTKIPYVTGYEISSCELPKGEFKVIRVVNNPNKIGCTIKNQPNGKKLYYRVRAFKINEDGGEVRSLYSNYRKLIFNDLTSKDETINDKYKRIFGKKADYYADWSNGIHRNYTSDADAMAHMTTVTIKAWDIGADGVKYTKLYNLVVNTKVAPTVVKIFDEIYKSKEQFPIKAIGGYNWRGASSTSQHNLGLAIDINPNENYMVDNGVASVGSYWKPGEDPYSIPAKSKLVKIFKKYGWGWGGDGWGTRYDYMHFSYFGT